MYVPGVVLSTKVVIGMCRKHGPQFQAARYLNGSLFFVKFSTLMGLFFKISEIFPKNGANLVLGWVYFSKFPNICAKIGTFLGLFFKIFAKN